MGIFPSRWLKSELRFPRHQIPCDPPLPQLCVLRGGRDLALGVFVAVRCWRGVQLFDMVRSVLHEHFTSLHIVRVPFPNCIMHVPIDHCTFIFLSAHLAHFNSVPPRKHITDDAPFFAERSLAGRKRRMPPLLPGAPENFESNFGHVDEDMWEVEAVVGKRIGQRRRIEYKVVWRGWPEDHCPWEPAMNIDPELVTAHAHLEDKHGTAWVRAPGVLSRPLSRES